MKITPAPMDATKLAQDPTYWENAKAKPEAKPKAKAKAKPKAKAKAAQPKATPEAKAKPSKKTNTCFRCKRTGRVDDLFGWRKMATKKDPDRRISQPWCKKCRSLAATASREGKKTAPFVDPATLPYEEVLAQCKEKGIPCYRNSKRLGVGELREALAAAP
jgi:hypothetical protein